MTTPAKYGYVSGWGATRALKPGEDPREADRYSKVLKYSSFMIQTDHVCSNSTKYYFNSTVSFCAGDGKGGNDTCKGDSGGAFVLERKRETDYRWIISGLVSWGEECAQKDHYGYYTRVYHILTGSKRLSLHIINQRISKFINGFYYIDTSVLLENISLVKFIKTTSETRVVYFP